MRLRRSFIRSLLLFRMGAHLSTPRTEKVSTSGGDLNLDSTVFGATSMQGWRISMEDAHLTVPKMLFNPAHMGAGEAEKHSGHPESEASSTRLASTDEEVELCKGHIGRRVEKLDTLTGEHGIKGSIYGVFDGHGGNCVSRWVSENFSQVFTKELKEVRNKYLDGNLVLRNEAHDSSVESRLVGEALQRCFLRLDEHLATPEVDSQLHMISNKKIGEDSFASESSNLFRVLLPERMSNRQHALELIQQLTNTYNSFSTGGFNRDEESLAMDRKKDDSITFDNELVKACSEPLRPDDPMRSRIEPLVRPLDKDLLKATAEPMGMPSDYMFKPIPGEPLLHQSERGEVKDGKLVTFGERRVLNSYDSIPYYGEGEEASVEDELGLTESGQKTPENKKEYDMDPYRNVSEMSKLKDEMERLEREEMEKALKAKELAEGNLEDELGLTKSERKDEETFKMDEDKLFKLEEPFKLEESFKMEEDKLEESLLSREDLYAMSCGATCVVVVVLEDPFPCVVVANAGDSRCVLSRNKVAVPLSVDHKPTDEPELRRIRRAGGSVINGRVDGNLNLSRSLGDLSFKMDHNLDEKEQKIISFPDVQILRLTKEDEFLVLACDGIWDCKSNQQVIDFIHYKLDQYSRAPGSGELRPEPPGIKAPASADAKSDAGAKPTPAPEKHKLWEKNKQPVEKKVESIWVTKQPADPKSPDLKPTTTPEKPKCWEAEQPPDAKLASLDRELSEKLACNSREGLNEKSSKILEKICEELCDVCLSSNPSESEGIGCDNMTVIIVQFNPQLYRKIPN